MEIVFAATVANFDGLSNDELLSQLMNSTDNVEYYEHQMLPGVAYNSGLGWQAVSDTSAILGIVSFLWQVYEKVILPLKNKDSNAGIIFVLQPNDDPDMIWIGSKVNSKEELLELIQVATKRKESKKGKDCVKNLKGSKSWKKIN